LAAARQIQHLQGRWDRNRTGNLRLWSLLPFVQGRSGAYTSTLEIAHFDVHRRWGQDWGQAGASGFSFIASAEIRGAGHYQERQGYVPRWVERGMDKHFSRAEQLEHRAQLWTGMFSDKGVLPEEFKPAHSVGDPLRQYLHELEADVEREGDVLQTLCHHFARAFRAVLRKLYNLDAA
jgi:hypothetical protein